jgi:hypothetical protein
VRTAVYGIRKVKRSESRRASKRAERAAGWWRRAPRRALLQAEEAGLCHQLAHSPLMALLWPDACLGGGVTGQFPW